MPQNIMGSRSGKLASYGCSISFTHAVDVFYVLFYEDIKDFGKMLEPKCSCPV